MEEPDTVLCDEELGIANACDFAQSLRDAFIPEKAFIVDLSNTQRIDTTIAQLICLYDREAKDKGLELSWRYSDAVLQTMKTLGLENIFQSPVSCVPGENSGEQT